jgi:hypothetical protein
MRAIVFGILGSWPAAALGFALAVNVGWMGGYSNERCG